MKGLVSKKIEVSKCDVGLLGAYVKKCNKDIVELQAMLRMFDEQSPMKLPKCVHGELNEIWKSNKEIENRYLNMKRRYDECK